MRPKIMTTKGRGARTVFDSYLVLVSLLSTQASGQTTFKVFQNILDPSVFGKNGGAILNATDSGFVDALTLCMRFQGCHIIDYRTSGTFEIIIFTMC